MRALVVAYNELAGKEDGLAEAVKTEFFKSEVRFAYLAMIYSSVAHGAYFAERLHKCVDSFLTHNDALQRIIVTRAPVDLVEIGRAYQALQGKTLSEAIAVATGHDYGKLLIAICHGV